MNRYTKIKDFHATRKTGVGSSDIPVLAGLYRNYGSTTLKLWQEKTGREERFKGNNRTYWGTKLEGMVLREFISKRYGEDEADAFFTAKRRGKSYSAFKTDTECRHPERQYCLAHSDLLVGGQLIVEGGEDGPHDMTEEPYIVEAKTAGMMAGKRREGQIFTGYDPDDLTAQGIPDAVFLQLQWQMYCYDIKTAYVAVLIDTADYREYGPITYDPRVAEKCLALAERFWRLVETDTPPAPETWDDVATLYPNHKNTTAMIGGEDEQRVREMISRDSDLAKRIKSIEAERDEIKNAIGILIGENSVLAAANGDVLAKSGEQSRESVAFSKIKETDPELAQKLTDLKLITKTKFRTLKY